ncbi:MAG: ribonuclease P protein component [Ruminococcus sp.]|nr:ribonuclease P protein component [Ruminococcus sp.]
MSRYVTIKENREFSRVYRRGKSFVSPLLVTYVIRSRDKNRPPRYGITTGKKVGNAVRRSRARRVIRASYDHLYPQLQNGWEMIFVARAKTPFVKSQNVEKTMKNHLKQAGVLMNRGSA